MVGYSLGWGAALVVALGMSAGCASAGPTGGASAKAGGAEDPGTVQRTIENIPGVASLADEEFQESADPRAAVVSAVPIEGSDLVRGHATVTVEAPIADVRKAVLRFKDYPKFMPHYEKAKVLGRTKDGARDVYMEIEALHGAVTMWARVEMPKPTEKDGKEIHQTRFVDGNVDTFSAAWTLTPVDADTTELSLTVFLEPSLPLPSSLINDENKSGARKGVEAMRNWIEKGGK